MHIIIWIIQVLLALAFLGAGVMKLVTPKPELTVRFGDWVDNIPGEGMKVIGALEVAGAVGLILPMALSILQFLTPLAAIGLCLTMLGAIILHLSRKEYSKLVPNLILLALSASVVVGRFAFL